MGFRVHSIRLKRDHGAWEYLLVLAGEPWKKNFTYFVVNSLHCAGEVRILGGNKRPRTIP